MKKTLLFLKKEILEMLPPTIFFFLVFHVLAFIKRLLIGEFGISLADTSAATIGALVVGKSILIVDALPILKWIHQTRHIYTILWRILFYLIIVTLFQFIEGLIPFISKYGSISAAIEHLLEEIKWNHFVALRIILLLFIVIYTLIASIIESVGRKEFFKIFFGKDGKINSKPVTED
jgi:hypothetical protein